MGKGYPQLALWRQTKGGMHKTREATMDALQEATIDTSQYERRMLSAIKIHGWKFRTMNTRKIAAAILRSENPGPVEISAMVQIIDGAVHVGHIKRTDCRGLSLTRHGNAQYALLLEQHYRVSEMPKPKAPRRRKRTRGVRRRFGLGAGLVPA